MAFDVDGVESVKSSGHEGAKLLTIYLLLHLLIHFIQHRDIRTIFGNWMRRHPAATGELVEVLTWVDGEVQGIENSLRARDLLWQLDKEYLFKSLIRLKWVAMDERYKREVGYHWVTQTEGVDVDSSEVESVLAKVSKTTFNLLVECRAG